MRQLNYGKIKLPRFSLCLLLLRKNWASLFLNACIISALVQPKSNNCKGTGSGMGVDVFVTRSSERNLSGNHMSSYSHVRHKESSGTKIENRENTFGKV